MEAQAVSVLDWKEARRAFLGSMCWIVGPGSSNGIPWPQVRRDVIIACNGAIERFVGQGVEYDNLWWLWERINAYEARREKLRNLWRRWAIITSATNVSYIQSSECQHTDVLGHGEWPYAHTLFPLETALRSAQWLGFRRFIIVGYSMRNARLAQKITRFCRWGHSGHLFDYARIYCLGKSLCPDVQGISASTALEMRGAMRDRLG